MAFDDQSGDSGGTISNINVTPLVDVMLVLLVIFMVTAPILQQGVSLNLPKVKSAALTGDDQQLVLSINKAGQLYLNDTLMKVDEIAPKLQAIFKLKPDKQVFVRADQDVRYGEVMRLIAAIKAAGIERVGMVTEPPKDSAPSAPKG